METNPSAASSRESARETTWRWSRLFRPANLAIYGISAALALNADPDPRAASTILGLLLVVLGETLRMWAAGHLRKNVELSTTGPYAHLQHPLYAGTFLIAAGLCLMARNPGGSNWLSANLNWIVLTGSLGVLLLHYLPQKRRREAERLRERFGTEWQEYARAVPAFLPRWQPYERTGAAGRGRGGQSRLPNTQWQWERFRRNHEDGTLLAVTSLVAAILLL